MDRERIIGRRKCTMRSKVIVWILTIAFIASGVWINTEKAYAWSTGTYSTSGAGYYLYVRRTPGSTLLGIMHIQKNTVGVYNTFTASVGITGQVGIAVSEKNSGFNIYTYNDFSPNEHKTVIKPVSNPTKVYGYMTFSQ